MTVRTEFDGLPVYQNTDEMLSRLEKKTAV